MLLSRLPTEGLIHIKTNGVRDSIRAHVQPDLILVNDEKANIEVDDVFVRSLPNGNTEYYLVLDPGFYTKTGSIPAHFQIKFKKIKELPIIESKSKTRPRMIFISHSTKDKEFTKAFVDFLFAIGLNEDDIVCSSYPGVGVPLGENVYSWLVEKFQEYDLHVIYFLSHNYYKSVASLNEMGAAWAMKQKWDSILLPGFSFQDIKGCIDPSRIGIKLDGDCEELFHRLNELKDAIVQEFSLRAINSTRWEKIRKEFVDKIHFIQENSTINQEST